MYHNLGGWDSDDEHQPFGFGRIAAVTSSISCWQTTRSRKLLLRGACNHPPEFRPAISVSPDACPPLCHDHARHVVHGALTLLHPENLIAVGNPSPAAGPPPGPPPWLTRAVQPGWAPFLPTGILPPVAASFLTYQSARDAQDCRLSGRKPYVQHVQVAACWRIARKHTPVGQSRAGGNVPCREDGEWDHLFSGVPLVA